MKWHKNSLNTSAGMLAIFALLIGSVTPLVEASPALHSDEQAAQLQATLALAERGDPKAQYDLARRYERADGVPQDYTNAVHYLRLSASQGNADAQILLGSFFGRGLGVAKDPEEAVKWYRKAAEQKNALAEFALGGFYANGKGVPKDMNKAIQWWQKAAAQNLAQAQDALGQYYFQQGETNRAAYVIAAMWLRKAAEQGYVASMNNLGVLYDFGMGVTNDCREAAKWYRAAAEDGNPKAQANLGVLYFDGRGVTNDFLQAYVWLKLSADQGSAVGKKYLLDYQVYHLLTTNQLAEAEHNIKENLESIRARRLKDLAKK